MKNEDRLKVVFYGLGPIGMAAARVALARESIKIVGAVDIDPELVGRDLEAVLGEAGDTFVAITNEPDRLFEDVDVDVVIHATGSRLEDVYMQLSGIVGAGVNVVSSCEELLFPWLQNPKRAEQLARLASSTGVSVLGTGVNPGFVLDTLAIAMTGVCIDVTRIEATRVVDASTRRGPLVRKVGAGRKPEDFDRSTLGHKGLQESLALVADATGLGERHGAIDIEETLDPVIAEERMEVGDIVVEPGQVAGIHQVAVGTAGGIEVLRLDLSMYVGAKDPHDRVRIEGDPPIDLRIDGGVAGDQATAGILVNMASLVADGPPGVLTMADLPVPRWSS